MFGERFKKKAGLEMFEVRKIWTRTKAEKRYGKPIKN